MGVKESLLELERRLWNGDEAFYRERLYDEAVMVFPAPTGILERTEVLASVGAGDSWKRIEFSDERVVELNDQTVQLLYRADATRREDGSEYNVLVTTTYTDVGGTWNVVSHQQTPIED